MPTEAPAKRMLDNAEAYVAENPEEAHGYYVLGRIHYLIYATQVAWSCEKDYSGQQPQLLSDRIAGYFSQIQAGNHNAELFSSFAAHRNAAISNFKKAISIDRTNALYELGIGSLYMQASLLESDHKRSRSWCVRARKHLMRAHRLAANTDFAIEDETVQGLIGLVAYEAGTYILQLDTSFPPRAGSLAAKQHDIVAANMAKLEDQPVGPITPIVVALKPGTTMDEIDNPDAAVLFDLDGDGRLEKWTWVNPAAGILVWDPARTGKVSTGKQLFGTASWWVLLEDGYQALELLDDDRDGWLKGSELKGISLWIDKNGNGISESGEVKPIDKYKVVAISTKCTRDPEGILKNERGAVTANGKELPTYDWIARPVEEEKARTQPKKN